MSYQLWTSPITGYRRIGTKLSDVRSLFEKGITTSAIFETLKSCPADESAFTIKETLEQRDFDVVGVMESRDGPVIGYVNRSDLNSDTIRKHMRPITPGLLVADSTSIADLFKVLCKNEFLFILNKTRVEGIVTRADLNKPPVRVYLFGLISLLEMHMGFWVRHHYKDETWQGEISESRIKLARDLLAERKKNNQEIDLFECLQFSDKRDLLLKRQEIRDQLSITSKTNGEKFLWQAEQLRNSLAHSQQDISQGLGWTIIFDTILWIEEFLGNSDAYIENFSENTAKGFNDSLW